MILVGLLFAGLGTFFFVQGLDRADKWASVSSFLLALYAAKAGVVGRRQARRFGAAEETTAVRQALLGEVAHQARSFLGQAQVRRPAEMPVHWCNSRLPGVGDASRPDVETGSLSDLHGVFGGQRLVILGEAGSGKTVAAHRMVADRLDTRRQASDGDSSSLPAPVLIETQGWDPGNVSFERWLVDRIVELYFTGDSGRDRDMVRMLLRRGEIELFIDGFDDLPLDARAALVHELNRQEMVNVVLCCRTEAYAETARQERLRGAPVIELQGLTGAQIIDYLRQWQTDPPPLHWQVLLDELRDSPSSPLAQALANPLMLAVLRDTHDESHPLSVRDFPIRVAAEDALLDRFIGHAYSERPDDTGPTPEQAVRTLGYLARRLQRRGLRQFGWWELPSLLPLPYRILGEVAGSGLFLGICLALTMGIVFGRLTDAIAGLLIGLVLAPLIHATSRTSGKTPAPLRSTRFRPKELISRQRWKELAEPRTWGWLALIGAGGGATLMGISLLAQPDELNEIGLDPAAAVPLVLLMGALAGLVAALILGFALGPILILADGFRAATTMSAAEDGTSLDPVRAWREDRRVSVRSALLYTAFPGLPALVFGVKLSHPNGVILAATWFALLGATLLLLMLMEYLGSIRWDARIAFVTVRLASRSVAGGLRLLEDARERGILRTVGARYEFRHARLQARLAAAGAQIGPATNAVTYQAVMADGD